MSSIKKATISIIAAIGRNRELGKNNELLWRIPDDLKRFRDLTRHHPVIMGRKTFESIVASRGSGLPERPNIVVTRDMQWHYDGVIVVHSVEQGIEVASGMDENEVFIIGGGEIYAQALSHADKLYLTIIDDTQDADTYFPAYEEDFKKKTFDESHEWNGLKYRWVDCKR